MVLLTVAASPMTWSQPGLSLPLSVAEPSVLTVLSFELPPVPSVPLPPLPSVLLLSPAVVPPPLPSELLSPSVESPGSTLPVVELAVVELVTLTAPPPRHKQ